MSQPAAKFDPPTTPLEGYKQLADIKDQSARRKLNRLCTEVRELQEQIKALEAAKDAAMAEVKPLLVTHRLTKVQGDGWLIVKTTSQRKTIRADRLIELEVPMDVIEKATEIKEVESVSVRGGK